jgi:hypothetical protein
MDQASVTDQSKIGKRLAYWLIGSVASSLVLWAVLGWFDNSTELIPSHENVLQSCFVIAGLAALVAGGMIINASKGTAVWRRIGLTCSFALLWFLSVFIVCSDAANIIEGLIDFPSGKTRSYTALLLISRAYQTHGKSRSWNIQTTPIWSNLDITESDFEFMQTHQRTGDGRNPDEISSKGFFCARVMLQQSGDAIRIMHAGSHKLPEGTVIICPPNSGN